MICKVVAFTVAVSYTHLDVYKRQEDGVATVVLSVFANGESVTRNFAQNYRR